MKWEEIEKQYKDQRVFVEVTKMDEDYEVLEGNVVFSDTNEKRFWKRVKHFQPGAHKDFAAQYMGEPPEDWAVML